MTCADKLRDLLALWESEVPGSLAPQIRAMDSIVAAFPDIIAVIAAAEKVAPTLHHSADCPRGGSIPGCCICGLDDYVRALAALNARLTEGGAA